MLDCGRFSLSKFRSSTRVDFERGGGGGGGRAPHKIISNTIFLLLKIFNIVIYRIFNVYTIKIIFEIYIYVL